MDIKKILSILISIIGIFLIIYIGYIALENTKIEIKECNVIKEFCINKTEKYTNILNLTFSNFKIIDCGEWNKKSCTVAI